jgi:hypothetical protein
VVPGSVVDDESKQSKRDETTGRFGLALPRCSAPAEKMGTVRGSAHCFFFFRDQVFHPLSIKRANTKTA